MPIADICRKAGISPESFFSWKRKYDVLLPTELRRLKQLEKENAKPRKTIADTSLDKEMREDVLRQKTVKPVRSASPRPQAIGYPSSSSRIDTKREHF